jgi:mycothiol synthase
MNDRNFIVRSARWEDLEAVADLIRVVLTTDGDAVSVVSAEDLARAWKSDGFNLEMDAWVAAAKDGRVIGFEEFTHRHAHAYFNGDGYVHPEFHRLGIGTALLQKVEERARAEMLLADPDLRVYIRAGTSAADVDGRAMFESAGYQPVRYNWVMEVNLTEAPKIKPLPDGIELRPFEKGAQDDLVFQAEEEAFQDHWGYVPGHFENWKLRKLGREEFDPTLWHIAWDDDRIAGFSQTRYRNGIGWIGTLGVRRPWRKRGVGEALLLHSFNEFYKRGMTRIGLGVDASNPTGATRLYQKVGMAVAVEDVIYEKELRPGKEISVQSL